MESESHYVVGVSLDPKADKGHLAPGGRLLWAASTDTFKAVLLEVDEDGVDDQLDLMGGWREAGAYSEVDFAEAMMGDRLEHLRGKQVKFRGNFIAGLGLGFTGSAILARYDDVLPGDLVWSWLNGNMQVDRTWTHDGHTQLTRARHADVRNASKHHLVAVVDRDATAATERRITMSKSGKIGSEAWLVDAP